MLDKELHVVNQNVKAINLDGQKVDSGRLTKLLRFEGTKKVAVEKVVAGDIVIIAGLTKATVADTICDISQLKNLCQVHQLILPQCQLV